MKNISLNKERTSPFWCVTFVASDGRKKRRSTKVPHEGGLFQGDKLTKAQAEKRAWVEASRIAEATVTEYEAHENRSIRALFDIMLGGKLGRVTARTYDNARVSFNIFMKWAGGRADEPFRLITRADAKEFVLWRRGQVRAETVRKDLIAIRSAYEWAADSELITKNPFVKVAIPPDARDEKILHEAFSWQEVQLLIEKLPSEWASAVRCCVETFGQRMSDILALEWSQFYFDEQVVKITTGKTRRVLVQPMRAEFAAWARARYEEAVAEGGDAALYVHPRLRAHSNPSAEFTTLVRLHGIGLSGTAGGGNRRSWHSKTFHSLRATCVTQLQAAGVTQGMAMHLVGHETQDVHRIYLRPDDSQVRDAGNALPPL